MKVQTRTTIRAFTGTETSCPGIQFPIRLGVKETVRQWASPEITLLPIRSVILSSQVFPWSRRSRRRRAVRIIEPFGFQTIPAQLFHLLVDCLQKLTSFNQILFVVVIAVLSGRFNLLFDHLPQVRFRLARVGPSFPKPEIRDGDPTASRIVSDDLPVFKVSLDSSAPIHQLVVQADHIIAPAPCFVYRIARGSAILFRSLDETLKRLAANQ